MSANSGLGCYFVLHEPDPTPLFLGSVVNFRVALAKSSCSIGSCARSSQSSAATTEPRPHPAEPASHPGGSPAPNAPRPPAGTWGSRPSAGASCSAPCPETSPRARRSEAVGWQATAKSYRTQPEHSLSHLEQIRKEAEEPTQRLG